MIKGYFIVCVNIKVGTFTLPVFITCAEINGQFFRIDNLLDYQNNIGGITDEKIDTENFTEITHVDWKGRVSSWVKDL